MMTDAKINAGINANERIDDLCRDNLRLIQNTDVFCFGMDAVLLSTFAKAGKNQKVLDMGTGNGVIPILMQAKNPGSMYTGLEIQDISYDLAVRNVELNSLSDKVNIVKGDIKEAINLYDEIKSVIKEDEELINLSKNRLNKDCYQDENLNLLTMDIAYFIENFNEEKKQEMIKVDKCWYVGANMEGVDYFDEFVKNGYWENGYENKYLDKVKSMQVGDKIVIKSAYTQKRDLPFDVNNKSVAVMKLKAKGTIIEIIC